MNRKQFIAEVAAIAGLASVDAFELLRISSAQNSANVSKDIRDYPHITDVITSNRVGIHFPIIVESCSDPKLGYLSEIPFLIELEVCKIWKESLFEWDAISVSGAGGLQQLMPPTAKIDLGLSIADSLEISELSNAISENNRLQKEINTRVQNLHKEAESGDGDITNESISNINKLRAEIKKLREDKEIVYARLQSAKKAYAEKVRSLSENELSQFDARFVPSLAVPAGLKYVVNMILECKRYFGGSIDINIWRGIAAYNSGLKTTKDWNGMPFISQTVLYTRDILLNLTKMLELKYAYASGDSDLIARTKERFNIK